MGCLNSHGQFHHWFGNIHLSGPCNRSCYFCIGQHMMALDSYDNLDSWPLAGLEDFAEKCKARGVREVNLTGTNTDPLLYGHIPALAEWLRAAIPGVELGIRTNGALAERYPWRWRRFDKASISITSLDPVKYRQTMGSGHPPDVRALVWLDRAMDVKANVVLCRETVGEDLHATVRGLVAAGIKRINLREPYGQPHAGNPYRRPPDMQRLGMPIYIVGGAEVCYWDVHHVEVESVNLYASGRVSETYPITRGHDDTGEVHDQSYFPQGRQREQWVQIRRERP